MSQKWHLFIFLAHPGRLFLFIFLLVLFFNFLSDQLIISTSTEPIFTKFAGLVDLRL